MNVEQRHNAQRNIFFRESVSVRDIRGRYGQIEMPQRNALGPPRASAGVQDEGNVIRGWFGRSNSSGSAGQAHVASLVHFHGHDWNLAVRLRSPSEFSAHI